jgi:hypothetical protein
MPASVALLLGSPKGLFILEGPRDGELAVRGPLCEGWPVHDASIEPGTGAILAGAASPWWGPAVWRSDDFGASWTHSSEGLTYGDGGPAVTRVWNVTGRGGGTVYAGVEPAGLFRSEDGGRSWRHVDGLTAHPSRAEWTPGNGGLMLHSIVPSPTDPARLWVGISAVGVFETGDGGATWQTRNRGVRADFNPVDRFPEFGQCVHKVVLAADGGGHLYQQNHCGVYRSTDGGAAWEEITAGLPSEFGFVMGAHPRDPGTAWVIPLKTPDIGRTAPDNALGVWRTHDGGDTWIRSGDGLPQRDAYVGVLREAMSVDAADPCGVWFGTSTGQVYGSIDEGRTWRLVATNLPPIWSVEAVPLG